MSATVVISVYNEGPMTEWTIRGLFEGPDPGVEFDVVVVDDGSTDGGVDSAKDRWGDHSGIKWAVQDRKGIVRARHAGAQLAEGETVVFLDAHSWPLSGGWLADLVGAIEGEIVVAGPTLISLPYPQRSQIVTGAMPFVSAREIMSEVREGQHALMRGNRFEGYQLERKWYADRPADIPYQVPAIPGGCLAVSAEWYRQQPFDHGLRPPFGWEDLEYSLRAWRYGKEVRVVPTAFMGVIFWPAHRHGNTSGRDSQYNVLRSAVRLLPWHHVTGVLQHYQQFAGYQDHLVSIMRDSTLPSRYRIDKEAGDPDAIDRMLSALARL